MGREAVLGEIALEVHDLLARVERLVGARVASPDVLVGAVRRRVEELEDPVRAVPAARAIMGALFPYVDPGPEFWATETGQLCARAIGFHRPVCPFQQAAWILNVTRQRVYQMADEGLLVRMETEPNEGGGVSPSSLREHLWTRGRRPTR